MSKRDIRVIPDDSWMLLECLDAFRNALEPTIFKVAAEVLRIAFEDSWVVIPEALSNDFEIEFHVVINEGEQLHEGEGQPFKVTLQELIGDQLHYEEERLRSIRDALLHQANRINAKLAEGASD